MEVSVIPNTAAGLLVIVLAVLPGLPGDKAYRLLHGVSWRERESRQILRLVSLSIAGLAIWVLLADAYDLAMPSYVLPTTFTRGALAPADWGELGTAYLGHLLGSTVAGAGGAFLARGLQELATTASQRDAWEQFAHASVPKHWLLVRVKTGEVYAGILDHADVAVEPEYRDIILKEPAVFDELRKCYIATSQQQLFVPGSQIVSLATVWDGSESRVTAPTETLFNQEENDGRQISTSTPLTGMGTEAGHEAGSADDGPQGSDTATAPGT